MVVTVSGGITVRILSFLYYFYCVLDLIKIYVVIILVLESSKVLYIMDLLNAAPRVDDYAQ